MKNLKKKKIFLKLSSSSMLPPYKLLITSYLEANLPFQNSTLNLSQTK